MSKSIELSTATIIKTILIIVGFSVVIFLLNSYDGSRRSNKFMKNISNLKDSAIRKDLMSQLDTLQLDSISSATIKELKEKVSLLSGALEVRHIYKHQLIFKSDTGYQLLSGDRIIDKGKLSENTEKIIAALENGAEVHEANTRDNVIESGRRSLLKIVYPLSKLQDGNWYIQYDYYNSH